MLNSAVIIGRLTADPELKSTPAGRTVTSFRLAVDRDFKGPDGQKQTDFIDIAAWGKTAEFAAKWLKKGMMIAASGHIRTRSWEDKEGARRRAFEVVADNIYFAESRRREEAGGCDAPFEGELDLLGGDDTDLPF